MTRDTTHPSNSHNKTNSNATVNDHASSPHLWMFWVGSGYDSTYFSSQALQYVDVSRGDLVIIDGRGDAGYVQHIADERNIPLDCVYTTQATELPFSRQLVQQETRSIGEWIRQHTSRIVLTPFSTCTATFVEFMFQLRRDAPPDLQIEREGESIEWATVFGNKGIVHRRLDEASGVWQRVVGEESGDIRAPRGFLCRGKEEIREAWRRLGDPSVALKEIDSSGGFGVHFLRDPAELDALDIGQVEVIVEEDLRLRHERLDFLTIHYAHGEVGAVMDQKFENGTCYIGSRTIAQDTDVVRRIREGARRIVSTLRPRHVGGFDIAVGDGRDLYVLDVNSARFNGTHTAMALKQWRFPEHEHFAYFKASLPRPETFAALRARYADLDFCEASCFDGRTARWLVVGSSPEECAAREATLRDRLR